MAKTSAPSRGKRTLLMKTRKLVSIWQICIKEIEVWLFKTGPFHSIWSSRNTFESHQYFKIQTSPFAANFQLIFFSCGITQNWLSVMLMISKNKAVFEDIKISLGLFISARKNQAELCEIATEKQRYNISRTHPHSDENPYGRYP